MSFMLEECKNKRHKMLSYRLFGHVISCIIHKKGKNHVTMLYLSDEYLYQKNTRESGE